MSRASHPETIYLRDYKKPVFSVIEVDLTFNLYQDYVDVDQTMKIKKNSSSSHGYLHLDGDGIDLKSIHVDGVLLSEEEFEIKKEEDED